MAVAALACKSQHLLVAHNNHHGHHNTTNSSRVISYASLKNNATKEAKNYVHKKDGVIPEVTGYTLSVDGKTQDGDIDLSKYAKGYSTLNIKETVTAKDRGQSGSIITDSVAYLFQQEYSSVIGIHNKNMTTVLPGYQETKPVNKIDFFTKGTPTEKLPTTGKFNYSGPGKVKTKYGVRDDKFSYNVDFANKTGSGS